MAYMKKTFDASEEICKSASQLLGFPVACARFEDLAGSEQYDGIWACASLLHVSGKDLPDVMKRLRHLLRLGGVIYASFKYGSGERTKDGRFFCDMTDESCRRLFEGAGLTVIESFMNADTREGREDEKWVNVIGEKR